MVVRENNVDNYYYTYTDHLGSIVSVTNNTGAIVAEQNFDAWGRNRNPNIWTYTNVPTVPNWLYRGYTGHEHLASVGLINMNGRMYDPILGRMLSVDNYVQAGGMSQGYNRYAYVLNNPLKYNDPSGENPAILIGAITGGFINLGIGLVSGEVHDGWDALAYFGTGALIGGLATATGGASLVSTSSVVANTAISGAIYGGASGLSQGVSNASWQKFRGREANIVRSGLEGFVGGVAGGAFFGTISGLSSARSAAKASKITHPNLLTLMKRLERRLGK